MGWFTHRQHEPEAVVGEQGPKTSSGDATHGQLAQRVAALEEEARVRLNRQLQRLDEHTRELNRLGPQVAALEARLEHLRKRVDTAAYPSSDPVLPRQSPDPTEPTRPDRAPAPASTETAVLLAEVQRQHQQVRARLSAATRYEERLRRVEDQLAQADAGVPHLGRD
ncbi:hypothetical protein [Nocardioides insulae]|uniref:hypothetical protein n=1 Tax=Nocardioides insulae TaxID=394734 RepID=UPI00040C985E|nr:hypothetical protein [Nocardioides insulae]